LPGYFDLFHVSSQDTWLRQYAVNGRQVNVQFSLVSAMENHTAKALPSSEYREKTLSKETLPMPALPSRLLPNGFTSWLPSIFSACQRLSSRVVHHALIYEVIVQS
jgi:hypothetical protein